MTASKHEINCSWHIDQYDFECDCGAGYRPHSSKPDPKADSAHYDRAKHWAAILRLAYRWQGRWLTRDPGTKGAWGVMYQSAAGRWRWLGANALEMWGRGTEARLARGDRP